MDGIFKVNDLEVFSYALIINVKNTCLFVKFYVLLHRLANIITLIKYLL